MVADAHNHRARFLPRCGMPAVTAGYRALVVDDDDQLRVVLAEYLRTEGFVVAEAAHGGEALEMARVALPDVLVLDVHMPRKDGASVLAEWIVTAELKAVPVVLMSAAADLAEIAERLGIRATLAKPFDLDALLGAINWVITLPGPAPRHSRSAEQRSPRV
jgi:DNA-binding response OmpR family regulator